MLCALFVSRKSLAAGVSRSHFRLTPAASAPPLTYLTSPKAEFLSLEN